MEYVSYQEGFAPPSDPAGSTQSAPAARANLGNRGVRRSIGNTRGVPVVTVVLITVDGRNPATIWDNLPINWCRISSINSFVKKSVIIAKTTKNSPRNKLFESGTRKFSGDHVWNVPLEYSNVPSFCAFFTRVLRVVKSRLKHMPNNRFPK